MTLKANIKIIKRAQFNGCKRIKFYVKNKKIAKKLKTFCAKEKKSGFMPKGARIYVKNELIYSV